MSLIAMLKATLPVDDSPESFLSFLDTVRVECDGLCRVISSLLLREKIPHRIFGGQLEIEGIGHFAPHFWIVLEDGRVWDQRARMWFGDDPSVPHGIFHPTTAQIYTPRGEENPEVFRYPDWLFEFETGVALQDVPHIPISLLRPDQCSTKP